MSSTNGGCCTVNLDGSTVEHQGCVRNHSVSDFGESILNAIKECDLDKSCKGYSIQTTGAQPTRYIKIATTSNCPSSYSPEGNVQDVGALITCGAKYNRCFIKKTRKTIVVTQNC